IGPPPSQRSYLHIPALISTAVVTGADAIHPGNDFFPKTPNLPKSSKNTPSNSSVPSETPIHSLAAKAPPREPMPPAGVPVVPGSQGLISSESDAFKLAEEIGFPVIIKATAGGGGRGMRIASDAAQLGTAIASARSEAAVSFGNGGVYLGKYLKPLRHVEIQVMAHRLRNCIHLGERHRSGQRRHQTVLEESPSPALTPELREQMGNAAVQAAKSIGYEGAGTIEFIFTAGRFYFMEMSTRIQVEHPVTGMITGVALMKEQIRVAS